MSTHYCLPMRGELRDRAPPGVRLPAAARAAAKVAAKTAAVTETTEVRRTPVSLAAARVKAAERADHGASQQRREDSRMRLRLRTHVRMPNIICAYHILFQKTLLIRMQN